jgi:hypothetical protein
MRFLVVKNIVCIGHFCVIIVTTSEGLPPSLILTSKLALFSDQKIEQHGLTAFTSSSSLSVLLYAFVSAEGATVRRQNQGDESSSGESASVCLLVENELCISEEEA